MKHIVLVDDDENIREIFDITFHDKYRVTGLHDDDAIVNREIAVPDLFVLDRMRFNAGGLDLCRFIKGDRQYNQAAVMILSAAPNIVSLGLAAGADMVIEKPFCLNYLQQQVERLAHHTRLPQKNSYSSTYHLL